MTTFNNLQTNEPAFVSHEKSVRQAAKGSHKRFNDCCFSFSNLALIVAGVVGLIFACQFLNDDSLYDYGEHLLSLRFYRQLVFIIVILPLILIVPIYNAVSAFMLPDRHKFHDGTCLKVMKLIYQAILAILSLIGLIFIAPSIRYGSVASQLGYEIRRHMKLRYGNDFSYVMLDRIQAEFECCDERWYSVNYSTDKLPLTCFAQDGMYASVYEQSCAEVIGSIVSTRCTMIAICLLIILLALASLIVIDLLETLTMSSQEYNVGSRETRHLVVENQARDNNLARPDLNKDQRDLVEELSNRLKASERMRETPLLTETGSSGRVEEEENEEEWRGLERASQTWREGSSPILTRASYLYNKPRPQSPVFLKTGSSPVSSRSATSPSPSVTKGVLKKTSSFQRINTSPEDSDSDGDNLAAHQRQMSRDLQNRRSLLNVRFAE